MNKKLLILPAALLLAACGGGGNNDTYDVYGKTFAYKEAYYERTEESDKWLKENFNNIYWNNDETGARIVYQGKNGTAFESIVPPANFDKLWSEAIPDCYEDVESKTLIKNFTFKFDEYNEKGTSGTITTTVGGVEGSGSITVTDVDGAKHGEAVNYEGTLLIGGSDMPISGTLKVGKVTENKLVYSDIDFVTVGQGGSETIFNNDIKLVFPLKDSNEDYEILGRINFLPVEK